MKRKIGLNHLRLSVALSMLAAVSIVLGKYLAFNIGEFLRFSLENLPTLFVAAVWGPVAAALVAAVADLVGSLMVGYAINPIITLGAVTLGVVSGTSFRLTKKMRTLPRVAISVLLGHLCGSVLIKSLGLTVFYGTDFSVIVGWRLLNYLAVGAIEGVILLSLLRSKAVLKAASYLSEERGTAKGMSYNEALEYIHGVSWTFCKPGLDRIRELCESLGSPQRKLKFIHVAGTNGKGSFSSMTANILSKAGYRVGLFTSPYVLRFNERIQINGVPIPDATLAKITERVKPIADAMVDKPTEFEFITAIGLEYFATEDVDVVVLEAGLGGRLDSTNIIESPLLSVITGISLDHTAILGDTVEKIATEKAGIIKEGSPVLFGGEWGQAYEVISSVARERGSACYITERDKIFIHSADLSGTSFDYKCYTAARISLLGLYQPYNAATVLEAVEILKSRGLKISRDAVYEGLASAVWHARFEIIGRSPLFIFDGAHNPEGISEAVRSIKHYFGEKRVYIISGVLRDKDYGYIAGRLSEVAERVFTITPDNPRALTAEEYRDAIRSRGADAVACENIEEAIRLSFASAIEDSRAVICLGSLYTYCEVIEILNKE